MHAVAVRKKNRFHPPLKAVCVCIKYALCVALDSAHFRSIASSSRASSTNYGTLALHGIASGIHCPLEGLYSADR